AQPTPNQLLSPGGTLADHASDAGGSVYRHERSIGTLLRASQASPHADPPSPRPSGFPSPPQMDPPRWQPLRGAWSHPMGEGASTERPTHTHVPTARPPPGPLPSDGRGCHGPPACEVCRRYALPAHSKRLSSGLYPTVHAARFRRVLGTARTCFF